MWPRRFVQSTQGRHSRFAVAVEGRNEHNREYKAKVVVKFLELINRRKCVIQTDGEPAILELARMIPQKRNRTTVLRLTAVRATARPRGCRSVQGQRHAM